MTGNVSAVHPGVTAWQSSLRHTDQLFEMLDPSALYSRPVPERHRLIFYLGHLEAFDWNLLARRSERRPSFHPTFDKLFEFGIDPEPGCLPQDQATDWPDEPEVRAYVARIRQELESVLLEAPDELVHTAIEHRLMHAETLAYLFHSLPFSEKHKPAGEAPDPGASVWYGEGREVLVPAGTATLGRAPGSGFGWDNEFPDIELPVPAFAIQPHKVTNGEYLAFVEGGGAVPHFWNREGGVWFYRGMFEQTPLPLNHPVYVTHEQASAYAAWKGAALPSEAQFHRAAYGTPEGIEREYPWGGAPPSPEHGNFDFQRWDPMPVDAHPAGDSAWGVSQLVGNGWEWTSSVFAPFPGFEPRPYYPGYSANFFDGDHYVMKGGSPRTAAVLLRRSFRNWFRPNYEYAYATFRCVLRTS